MLADFGSCILHIRQIDAAGLERRSSHRYKNDVGILDRVIVVTERKPLCLEADPNHLVQARLKDRRAARHKHVELRLVAIQAGYRMSDIRQHGSGYQPYITGPDDNDFHVLSFCITKLNKRIAESSERKSRRTLLCCGAGLCDEAGFRETPA